MEEEAQASVPESECKTKAQQLADLSELVQLLSWGYSISHTRLTQLHWHNTEEIKK